MDGPGLFRADVHHRLAPLYNNLEFVCFKATGFPFSFCGRTGVLKGEGLSGGHALVGTNWAG